MTEATRACEMSVRAECRATKSDMPFSSSTTISRPIEKCAAFSLRAASNDQRIVPRSIKSGLREQPDVVAVALKATSTAIVLNLVNPIDAGRDGLGGFRRATLKTFLHAADVVSRFQKRMPFHEH